MSAKKVVPFNNPNLRRHGKPRNRPFTKIDNEAVDEMRLSAADKWCLVSLRRFINKEGTCWPTHKQIGKLCGVQERSVNTYINKLKKCGWLEWAHFRDDYGQLRNRYIFTVPAVVAQQQLIAGGQQQPVAVKEDTSTLYCETTSPPSPNEPDKIGEDPAIYGTRKAL